MLAIILARADGGDHCDPFESRVARDLDRVLDQPGAQPGVLCLAFTCRADLERAPVNMHFADHCAPAHFVQNFVARRSGGWQ